MASLHDIRVPDIRLISRVRDHGSAIITHRIVVCDNLLFVLSFILANPIWYKAKPNLIPFWYIARLFFPLPYTNLGQPVSFLSVLCLYHFGSDIQYVAMCTELKRLLLPVKTEFIKIGGTGGLPALLRYHACFDKLINSPSECCRGKAIFFCRSLWKFETPIPAAFISHNDI